MRRGLKKGVSLLLIIVIFFGTSSFFGTPKQFESLIKNQKDPLTAGMEYNELIQSNNIKLDPLRLSSRSGNDTDVPTWLIGDYWTYYTVLTQNFTDTNDEIQINGNVIYTVSGIERYNLNGSIYLSYNLTISGDCVGQGEYNGYNVYIDGKSSDAPDPSIKGTVSGYRIVRVSDLAMIYDELHFNGYSHVWAFTFWLVVPTTVSLVMWDYDPIEECDFLNLDKDIFWFDTVERRIIAIDATGLLNDIYDNEYPFNHTVYATSNITDAVMAGTFDTYYLNGTTSDPQETYKKWYSPKLKNLVREIREKVKTSSTGYLYLYKQLSDYNINQTKDTIFLASYIYLKNKPLYVWGNFKNAINENITVYVPFTDAQWNTTTDNNGNFSVWITTPDRYDTTNTSLDNGSFGITGYFKGNTSEKDRVVSTTVTLFDMDLIPPIANAGPDKQVDEDTLVPFDGSGSTDNFFIFNYTWNYTFQSVNHIYYSCYPIITFEIPGNYIVTLNVTDIGNNSDTDTLNVIVNDITNPVAISQGNMTVGRGTLVMFNGSGSFDPEGGSITNYTWTVTRVTGTSKLYRAKPDIVFDIIGNYSILLEVKDLADNVGNESFWVNVKDITPPIADAGEDFAVNKNTDFHFNGSNSYDPGGGLIVNYSWSFTEDETKKILYGVTPLYNFDTPWTYIVTLKVTDESSNIGTDTVTVTVIDVTNPVCTPPDDFCWDEDTLVLIEDQGSYDPYGGEIVTYNWTFYDGIPQSFEGKSFEYTFYEPKIYVIKLNVTDRAGHWTGRAFNLTILDITPPNAVAGNNRTINAAETVSFNGSGSTDNVGIVAYFWAFEYNKKNVLLEGMETEYVFDIPGIYEVTLNASDKAGNNAEDTIVVTVQDTASVNKPPMFLSEPQLEAGVGVEWTYMPIVIDEDVNDTVVISFVSGPEGMTFTSRILRWAPTEAQLGDNDVKLEASDGNNSISQEFTVVVTREGPSNHMPKISPLENVTVKAGERVAIQIYATDEDGDVLSYEIIEGPPGIEINKYGLITWNTTMEDVGNYTIIVNVSDGKLSAMTSFNLHLVKSMDVDDGDNDGKTPEKSPSISWNFPMIMLILVLLIIATIIIIFILVKKKKKQEKDMLSQSEQTTRPTNAPTILTDTTTHSNEIPTQPPSSSEEMEDDLEE